MKKIGTSMMLAAVPALAAAQNGTEGQRPNIVFFLVDDLGWNDFSCYGSGYYQTPVIDSLATQGLLMTDAYAACTVSSPTRASLMTGKYPARLHLTDWIQGWDFKEAPMQIPDWTMYLPLEEKTTAEYLKEVGYDTWHVGKWHLGDDEKYWAENQGFDINIAGNFKGAPIKDNQGHKGYFAPYGLKRLEEGPDGEYLTERLTREAISLIEASDGTHPFFLNLCHYALHVPLDAPQNLVDKWADLADPNYPQNNPTYAAMVETVDESLRQIIAALKRKGVWENTLLIVTGDNGALKRPSPSIDLREGKGSEYEGGVREPMICSWPGHIQPGRRDSTPVISTDIMPTILEAAGVAVPKDIDGKSLIRLLEGRRTHLKNRPIFWHYPHYHKGGATPYSSVRKGDWILIRKYETGTTELYNLKKDLAQTTDLSAERKCRVRRMSRILDRWLKDTGAQFATFKNQE